MNVKTDSLTVLRAIYGVFQERKTLKTSLDPNDLKELIPELDINVIVAMVQYLAGHGYINYIVHMDDIYGIGITSKGIDYYLDNFQ